MYLGHVDLVDILIGGGADVNLHCADSGLTALMLAASQVLNTFLHFLVKDF